VVDATAWSLYPLERDPVNILQNAGRTPGLFWTNEKYIVYTIFIRKNQIILEPTGKGKII
jgi:hypothetical protein